MCRAQGYALVTEVGIEMWLSSNLNPTPRWYPTVLFTLWKTCLRTPVCVLGALVPPKLSPSSWWLLALSWITSFCTLSLLSFPCWVPRAAQEKQGSPATLASVVFQTLKQKPGVLPSLETQTLRMWVASSQSGILQPYLRVCIHRPARSCLHACPTLSLPRPLCLLSLCTGILEISGL